MRAEWFFPRRLRRCGAVFVFAALLSAGCRDAGPELYPVRGKILFKGRPVPGAEVAFHPQSGGTGWVPVATVGPDGSFEAGTRRPGDGAPAGKYRVTVVWRPSARDGEDGPNHLPGRYSQPQTSGIEVEAGPASASLETIHLTN